MLKMSGTAIKLIQKFASMQLYRNVPNVSTQLSKVPYINITRTLYNKSSLGLDNFEIQRERIKQQLSNLQEKFKDRMNEYVNDEKNMIFTEDLKNMIYLSENDEDLELLLAMLKRFNKQNQQLRFGDFKFGPIVMRLFHLFNKPKLAMECFHDDENFQGFFDQLITFQTYLDLLYNNEMYEEVLHSFRKIEEKQLEGALYPRNSLVIALAACYKLNTKESYDYAMNIWEKAKKHGYYATRRAITFTAALALNQGHPDIALEIITAANNANYTTVRNLKVLIFSELGRLEEAVAILKSVLIIERGEHTFNEDVMAKLKSAVVAINDSEISAEFNRIEVLLQNQGLITKKTLDEQLSSEIQKAPTQPRPQYDRYSYNSTNRGFQQQTFRPNFGRTRPGLEDIN